MRVALMFNFGNRNLKSLGVKATKNYFNTLKFTMVAILIIDVGLQVYSCILTFIYLLFLLDFNIFKQAYLKWVPDSTYCMHGSRSKCIACTIISIIGVSAISTL